MAACIAKGGRIGGFQREGRAVKVMLETEEQWTVDEVLSEVETATLRLR